MEDLRDLVIMDEYFFDIEDLQDIAPENILDLDLDNDLPAGIYQVTVKYIRPLTEDELLTGEFVI